MKAFTVIVVFLFVVFTSCVDSIQEVNGPVYEMLSPEKYNKLQQRYTYMDDFELGTSRVSNKAYWGLINSKGKEILKLEYDTIYPLVFNHRIVKKSSKFGLVDRKGKILVPCKYDNCMEYLNNGVFAFQLNDRWGFISDNDDIKVQFKYETITQIADSVFVGTINGCQGLFNYHGEVIINPEYDRIFYKAYGEKNGISYAKKGDRYAIINSKNQVVTECEFSFPSVPYGNYVTFKNYIHKRFCLVNWETGEMVIPYGYEKLGDYVEGVLYACKNGKYGYINPNNEEVIPFDFADAQDFSEGFAMVGVMKGYHYFSVGGNLPKIRYGFIDKSGKFVINPIFADQSLNRGSGFKDGLAVMGVERDDNVYPDRYGYIDIAGEWVIKPIYTEADDFKNGVAVVKNWRGYGVIDKLGNIIVEPEYDDYEPRSWHEDKIVFKNDNGDKYEYTLDGVAI